MIPKYMKVHNFSRQDCLHKKVKQNKTKQNKTNKQVALLQVYLFTILNYSEHFR